MTIPAKTPYYLAVISALGLATVLAIMFGFLSPDSWYYMLIAQSLRHGQGCGVYGQYLASYPCGYPTALALTSPSGELHFLMVTSKIANLLMMGGSLCLLLGALKNRLAVALIGLNQVTLQIFMFTWSENLFLLGFSGVFYAITKISENPKDNRYLYLLGLFLIVGCFARYIFGPFAFILFVASWLVYGRALALKILPAFAVAGCLYLAYQRFNIMVTGYPTGMERMPAPETFFYSVINFSVVIGGLMFALGLGAAILIAGSIRQVRVAKTASEAASPKAALFLILAGIAYLAIAFTLRAQTYYDPYDFRTLGLGVVFVVAGLFARFVRLIYPDARMVAVATLGLGVYSSFYVSDNSIPYSFTQMRLGHYHYQFPPSALGELKRKGPPADSVVMFDMPPLKAELWGVENVPENYYGRGVTLISPQMSPDSVPDTAAGFVEQIARAKGRCYVDFMAYPDAAAFQDYLDDANPSDFILFPKPGQARVKSKPRLDPGLKVYLARIFRPAAFIPCGDILGLPESQALLAPQFKAKFPARPL